MLPHPETPLESHSEDDASTSFMPPQKRVRPQRSRRAAPGFTHSDLDDMIFEALKHKADDAPLVPANTKFILTTNINIGLVPESSTSASTSKLNVNGNESYFERPDVLEAYREQLLIQTPEFELIDETAANANLSRLRPKDDGSFDTSDVVYQKRHWRYEKQEKRQRHAEREKLKHEQYKLGERIDRLKSMDASAFMSLPAELFAHSPPVDGPPETESILNGDYAHAQIEGEKRRRQMLLGAYKLEDRYRVLLPPVRKTGPNVSNTYAEPVRTIPIPRIYSPAPSSGSNTTDEVAETVEEPSGEEDDDHATESDAPNRQPLAKPPKPKIQLSNRTVPAPIKKYSAKKSTGLSSIIRIPRQSRPSNATPPEEPPSVPEKPRKGRVSAPRRSGRPSQARPPSSGTSSIPEIATLARSSLAGDVSDHGGSDTEPPRKRSRRDPSPASTISVHAVDSVSARKHSKLTNSEPLMGDDTIPPGKLRCEAMRSAGTGGSRSTTARHLKAFAEKLPPDMAMEFYFELPLSIQDEDVAQERLRKYPGASFSEQYPTGKRARRGSSRPHGEESAGNNADVQFRDGIDVEDGVTPDNDPDLLS